MTQLLRAQHILVNHEYEAHDLIKKLKQGESFEKLARDFSNCASSKNDGHLGEFPRGRMILAFEKALLKLEVGQYSSPVKTQFGYHIIKRL